MRTFLVAGILLVGAATATAAPITYTHTGVGSGTLDDVPFGLAAPVEFTITATGDTENIESCVPSCLSNDNLTASITISGVGTFDFVTPTRYFRSMFGNVGFSRSGISGEDLFNGPAGVGAWDMASSIGPIGGTANLLQWSEEDVVTTGGVLVFDSGTTATTFQAVVGEPIPEPATMMLIGTGVLAAAVRRRMSRMKNRS